MVASDQQMAVCGQPTPAVGFAMGMERLCLLYQEHGRHPSAAGHELDVFFAVAGGLAAACAIAVPTYLWLGVRLHAVRPGLLRDLRGRGAQAP